MDRFCLRGHSTQGQRCVLLCPGGRPPVRFTVVAAALAPLVVAFAAPPGPLDDPDPADQRNGLLLAEEDALAVPDLALPRSVVGGSPARHAHSGTV